LYNILTTRDIDLCRQTDRGRSI